MSVYSMFEIIYYKLFKNFIQKYILLEYFIQQYMAMKKTLKNVKDLNILNALLNVFRIMMYV